MGACGVYWNVPDRPRIGRRLNTAFARVAEKELCLLSVKGGASYSSESWSPLERALRNCSVPFMRIRATGIETSCSANEAVASKMCLSARSSPSQTAQPVHDFMSVISKLAIVYGERLILHARAEKEAVLIDVATGQVEEHYSGLEEGILRYFARVGDAGFDPEWIDVWLNIKT